MADEKRSAADVLARAVVEDAPQFSFFEAVRQLRRAGVGDVRFQASSSLAFPASDIQKVEAVDCSDPAGASPAYRITVNFLGLSGAQSPLPTFYSEDLAGDDPDDNPRQAFMDFFHHRLLSLFYDCWKKYRYYIQYESGAADDFSRRLFALLGLYDDMVRADGQVRWPRLLGQAGLLAPHSRSPSVIEAVLAHYFHLDDVRVEQFILTRVAISDDQRNRLGRQNCELGSSLSLGGSVADRAGKFRLVLGPLSLARFRRFLPDADDHAALRDLMRVVQRQALDYDVELRLAPGEAPALALTCDSPCRLGWSSWLGGAPSDSPSVIVHGFRHAA